MIFLHQIETVKCYKVATHAFGGAILGKFEVFLTYNKDILLKEHTFKCMIGDHEM